VRGVGGAIAVGAMIAGVGVGAMIAGIEVEVGVAVMRVESGEGHEVQVSGVQETREVGVEAGLGAGVGAGCNGFFEMMTYDL
jgi:hypothetical protein